VVRAPEPAWSGRERLLEQQIAVGRLQPPPWRPHAATLSIAGCFVAFAHGEAGPGAAGDRAWVGAVAVDDRGVRSAEVVVGARAGGPYVPGLLALREGEMMYTALRALLERAPHVDAAMVDATGRDHPRSCGLAVHLGWALDVPTVGVTHRLLTGRHVAAPPPGHRGDTVPVGEVLEPVAIWVCTVDGTRPLVAHAGWRTDSDVAAGVALATSGPARTPEPLRQARQLARTARSAAGGDRPGAT
jgi:deoxyribonuclease V